MKWTFLLDESFCWKAHAVPVDLVPLLKADLEARLKGGQPRWRERGVHEVGLDLPGMAMIDRTLRSAEVDGLRFTVPSQDWSSVLYALRLKPLRHFADGTPYYKFHGWRFCVVLTPAQRDALVAAMEAQEGEADKEAEADNRRFVKKIDAVNERMGYQAVVSARATAIKNPKKAPN